MRDQGLFENDTGPSDRISGRSDTAAVLGRRLGSVMEIYAEADLRKAITILERLAEETR